MKLPVFDGIIENIQTVGPVFAGIWVLTILFTLLRPQRYLNSFLLMIALGVTVVFVAGFFGRGTAEYLLLGCFLLAMLALFLVPLLLIVNGIQMIRRESFSPAHALSLGLGVVVGIGEIASVIYVLGITDSIRIGAAYLPFLILALTVFYFSFLVLCFVVYSVFIQVVPHRMNYDYIVIHGCGLAGGERMTKLLSNRVDKAIEVYRKCRKKPVIIPSGGRGEDEKLSEAQAMKDYLVSRGIPEADILIEDRSKTTEENLRFSKAIIDARAGKKRTALVSSNYHIYRCIRLAKKAGFKCTGIGAKVALYYWPSALIREFIAVFVTRGFLICALIGYALFMIPAVWGFMV